MTDAQKDRIRQMKADGFGYIKIARELGLPENTVKSFCRREGLNRKAPDREAPLPEAGIGTCPCCGAKVVQNPGRKAKRFCSDKCRNKWWSSHPEQAGEMYRAIPEQGEVVKEIFAKYLSGASAYGIAKELSERGITGQKGVPMDDSTIKFILTNPSYTGSMLLQKNFISEGHTRKRNKGELPMYMVEGMFEPLIPQEDFEKAQFIRKQRADAAANKNPTLTAFSGLVKCGECGRSVSRRTTKYGKKWNCNTRERKGKAECGLRPVYETELEQAAVAALELAAFDGAAVRREVEQIVINADRIEFRMKSGKAREVMRAYQRGRSAFSQKITCGCCGRKLECDYWKMGPKGQKKKYKVWVCRGCSFRRLLDDEFREAVAAVLGSEDYEPRFVKEVADVTVFEDRFEFHFTDGEVAEWQRE